MNSKLNRQQFKVLFFVQGLFALHLAAPSVASAYDIMLTNYPIPPGAYFVSPDGNDNNSCVDSNFPCTATKALKLAKHGATIVFRGGTYRDIDSFGMTKRLTLQPYPGEKAWIKGSIVVDGWVAEGSIWRKDGWTYSFPPNTTRESIDLRYPMAGYRDMVYVNGRFLTQVASKNQMEPGKFYVDAANHRLYIGDNPAGKTVEATAKKQAFGIWKDSNPAYDPANTVVRGLGFSHYADTAINLSARGVTLENNTILWMGLDGVRWGGVDGIVRGNTFSLNGRKGLTGWRADRTLLEYNTISDNNFERFWTSWDAAGAKFIKTDGMVVRNNIFVGNKAASLWYDESSTNITIVNNISHNNLSTGIFFELSHKAIIASNLVYGNGGNGIRVTNSSSARVYNNTLAYNKVNVLVGDTKRLNRNPREIAQGITWIARDNVVKNNILSNTTGSVLSDLSNCDTREKADLMLDGADYNAYYRTSSNHPKTTIKWSLNQRQCSRRYTDLATFQQETGFERNGLGYDNVAINPFFVDEANGDFRLKSGSLAIGKGEPLPQDIASAIGLPSGMPVNLGALQSQVVLRGQAQPAYIYVKRYTDRFDAVALAKFSTEGRGKTLCRAYRGLNIDVLHLLNSCLHTNILFFSMDESRGLKPYNGAGFFSFSRPRLFS